MVVDKVVQLSGAGPQVMVLDDDETTAAVLEAFAGAHPEVVIPEAFVVFPDANSATSAGVAVSEATPGMDKAVLPLVVLLGAFVPETDEEKEEGGESRTRNR